MIDINNVAFQIANDVTGNEEIIRNLKVLLSTPAGTVIFDREFGIDLAILDKPLNIAKALLRVEYIEKIKKYNNDVSVEKITFESDPIEGVLKPKVVINIGN